MTVFFHNVINLFLAFLHLLILHQYLKALFGHSRKTIASGFIWIIYFIFQVILGLDTSIPDHVMLVGNIFLILLISRLSHYGSLAHCFIFSILIFVVWMLLEIILFILLRQLGLEGEAFMTAGSLISKMCMLILSFIVGRFYKGHLQRKLPLRYFFSILTIPIGSIFLIFFIFEIAKQHPEYSLFAVITGILLLLASYVIFEVYGWIVRDAEAKEQNVLYEQQLELCNREALERENLYNELHVMRHNMKEHLTVLLGMIQSNKNKEARDYIHQMMDQKLLGNPEEVSRSGNIVVDSLVNYKYAIAQKMGIDFEASILVPIDLPFKSGHLTIILGNLLENALDACRETEKPYIRLDMSYEKGILFITILNPYAEARKKDGMGKYVTTKKNQYRHGMGLISVEQAVSCYHGNVNIRDENGVFQVTVMMYADEEL